MKNLFIVFCLSALLYSCSENEAETIYVDRIVEVPVVTSGNEYPDSLKWFLNLQPDFIKNKLESFKDRKGFVVVSYGDNSYYNKNVLTATTKLPWHCITFMIYSSDNNGLMTPETVGQYIIHLKGLDITNGGDVKDPYSSWDSSHSGYNKNFYGDGQIVLQTSNNQ